MWRMSPALIAPAFAHLLLCVIVQLNPSEGSWQWFPIFVIDLPVSILLEQISALSGYIVYGVFGTLWWLILSAVIRRIYRQIMSPDPGDR